jgi:hypothetical protein
MANNNVFVEQTEYTGLALNYRNKELIADMVMPRRAVGSEKFAWLSFPKGDAFTIPDTKMGRTSHANQIEFGGTEVTDVTRDYALEAPVPNKDIAQFSATYDPLGRATELASELLALSREQRVAGIVFNTNTYATANKTTLSGTSQWSDYTNSDPVDAMLENLDGLLIRPNKLVLGRPVWTKLRKHPKVVSKVLGSVNSSGVVSRQALADILELDEVLVGASFLNSAKRGQTATYAEVWGKHAAFIYQSNNEMTFGFTAEFGARKMETFQDPRAGIDGTTIVRVSEKVKEVTPATDLGFFFQNAVA